MFVNQTVMNSLVKTDVCALDTVVSFKKFIFSGKRAKNLAGGVENSSNPGGVRTNSKFQRRDTKCNTPEQLLPNTTITWVRCTYRYKYSTGSSKKFDVYCIRSISR